LDWVSDDDRGGLSDGKDECTPAISNRAADSYPGRVRMARLEFRLAETLGGTPKQGWSPRKGWRLSLPRRSPYRAELRLTASPIWRRALTFFDHLPSVDVARIRKDTSLGRKVIAEDTRATTTVTVMSSSQESTNSP